MRMQSGRLLYGVTSTYRRRFKKAEERGLGTWPAKNRHKNPPAGNRARMTRFTVVYSTIKLPGVGIST